VNPEYLFPKTPAGVVEACWLQKANAGKSSKGLRQRRDHGELHVSLAWTTTSAKAQQRFSHWLR